MADSDRKNIIIGISSCLLGKKVRFDSGHKRDRFVTEILGQFVSFVPVCPEIEVGMGVPRESVRLTGDPNNPRMISGKSGKDWTAKMTAYSKKRVSKNNLEDLSGFILKNRSPSCGMERVKVYVKLGTIDRKGTGMFAKALMNQFSDLPVEEEGRLNDSELRENFIERVFAYKRLQNLFAQPFSRKSMIGFHTAHKYLLLSHSPTYYRQLGQLVAQIKNYRPVEFKKSYQNLFMITLKYKATVKKNTNVLQHIAGFLKKKLTKSDKLYIQAAITDYHDSLVPLVVPIILLKHFINKYEMEYIMGQYYLKL